MRGSRPISERPVGFQRQRRCEFRCSAGRHLRVYCRDRRWTGDILRARVNFATPSDLKYDLTARGESPARPRSSPRLRANVDLKASGGNGGGSASGSARLVDGRLYKRIEITPLLAPSPTDDDAYIPPNSAGIVPSPFNNWKVDLSVTNETPFLIQGNIASGEIILNLKFSGTLGNPIPEG